MQQKTIFHKKSVSILSHKVIVLYQNKIVFAKTTHVAMAIMKKTKINSKKLMPLA